MVRRRFFCGHFLPEGQGEPRLLMTTLSKKLWPFLAGVGIALARSLAWRSSALRTDPPSAAASTTRPSTPPPGAAGPDTPSAAPADLVRALALSGPRERARAFDTAFLARWARGPAPSRVAALTHVAHEWARRKPAAATQRAAAQPAGSVLPAAVTGAFYYWILAAIDPLHPIEGAQPDPTAPLSPEIEAGLLGQ